MNDDDFLVTIADIRAAKLCLRGGRRWAERYGLSWNDCISNGVPARQLIQLNDALANRVIAAARKRLGK